MKNIYIFLFLSLVVTCNSYAQNCDEPADAGCGRASGDWYWYWYDSDDDGVGTNGGTSDDGECFYNTPTAPEGFSETCGDCNDSNGNVTTQSYYYLDMDGDGYGVGTAQLSCGPTGNYTALNNLDCDDSDSELNPGTIWYLDSDGDTYGDENNTITQCLDPSNGVNNYVLRGGDCNDGDPKTTVLIFYLDSDGDGFGDPNNSDYGCEPEVGFVENKDDCDDSDEFINPDTIWYIDNDGDGYGNHNGASLQQCEKPLGFVRGEHDCNDNNAGIHPATIWYLDDNNDGYGDSAEVYEIQCAKPSGSYVLSLSPTEAIPSTPHPTYTGLDVNDLNYRHSKIPLKAVSTLNELESLSNDNLIENRVYYDGIGRPLQEIALRQGGFQEDIIQYIEYDRFGRAVKNYLPYAKRQGTTSGKYRINAQQETENFYQNGTMQNAYAATNNPFSESVYEHSPLNRVKRQSTPGNSWVMGGGNEVEMDYMLNQENDVRIFNVSLSNSFQPSLIDTGLYYSEGELAISIVKDENWVNGVNNTVEEYKDKEDRIILKRTYVDGIRLSTYYVYDDYNNLTYVIPPKAEPDYNPITPAILNKLCFQYKYDGLRRQVAKSKPDVLGWERVIYDREDRPILVKDPNLGASGQWLFTKYDKFGRVLYTGLYNAPISKTQEELQDEADTRGLDTAIPRNEERGTSTIGGVTIGYTNDVYPTTNLELLTVSYYDDYNYQDPDKPTTPNTVLGQTVTTNVKGMPVATWSRTIGKTTWNKNYTFYNERGAILRTYNRNHLGGYTIVETEIEDFRQKPIRSITKHKRIASDAEMTITDRFVYDQTERVKASYQKINNNPEKLVNGFVYDAMGKLLVKYIEPENEDFGYEMAVAGKSEEKNTFTATVSAQNWSLTSEKGASMQTRNQQLEISLQYDGTGVVGYYDFQAGVEYKISANLSLQGMTAFLDFGIWFGGTQLYTTAVTDSGVIETLFTPTNSGTHNIGFIMNGNTSGNTQTFTIDNALVQERGVAPLLVQQLKDINALQKIDYQYNARGSLTHINDPEKVSNTEDLDLFGYKINYDKVEEDTGSISKFYKPYFNGNISQVFWATANDNEVRSYRYRYDALNRIKKATFSDTSFNLQNVDYDKNGNITALERNLADGGNHDFQYAYNGNQLYSLSGSQTLDGNSNPVVRSYSYDDNGNMITDSSKNITNIEYNYLNQPERIEFSTGEIIEYDYEASGVKLQKRLIDNNITLTTDYVNGFQYDNGTLQFLGQPEGYVVQTITSAGEEVYDYVYNYTDHLGNVRLSYSDTDRDGHIDIAYLPSGTRPTNEDIDGDGDFRSEIVRENNYYPFGLQHRGYNTQQTPLASVFKYGFNGKELQEENGIAWLDFGSRNYDAELGRWFNTDPQNQFGSPYLYAYNNPISSIDPDGEFAFVAAAAIVAAIATPVVLTAINNPHADFTDFVGQGIKGLSTAVLTSGIGSGVNALGIENVLLQETLRAGAHGGFNAVSSQGNGASFWSNFTSGAASSGLSSAVGHFELGDLGVLAAAGIGGGISSELTGGKFSEGFKTGLTIAVFNHLLHQGAYSLEEKNKPLDYFDKDTGEYLGKGGTDEIRFISKEDWENENLDNYTSSANDVNIEAAVYEYYARKFNLIPSGAKGCQFCGGLLDGWTTSNFDGLLSFNFSPNSIGNDILNSFDAVNVLVHEISLGGHGGDFIRGTTKQKGIDANWEIRATRSQVNHWSWSGTSSGFKRIIYDYYGKYLQNQNKYFGQYGIPD